MYEPMLLRGTLVEIAAPQDYPIDVAELKIRAEIYKARFGRTVPPSDRVRGVLDSVRWRREALLKHRLSFRPHEAGKGGGS